MKILLVDHHALFRDGLCCLLRQSLDGADEIFEAGSVFDGLELAAHHPDLDLALLELDSPGGGGVNPVKLFRACFPHVSVVVVSVEEDCCVINKALEYGASAYVCKSATISTLLDAMRLASSSRLHVAEKLLRQLDAVDENIKATSADRRSNANEYGLTIRQMDVLRCLAAGCTNKEIASITGLAGGTIKMHLTAMYQTLRVRNRTDAIRAAREIGVIAAL